MSLQKCLPSQPKTSGSTVWRDSCRVSCHSFIFRTFLIFTHPGEHWQICGMSKCKYALKTTKIIYAVWLEIYAAWLGIYAVSVCHLFGRGLYPYQTSEKSVYPIIISNYCPFIRIYTWIHHYTLLISQVSIISMMNPSISMYIIPIPVASNTPIAAGVLSAVSFLCPKALAESLMSDVQATSDGLSRSRRAFSCLLSGWISVLGLW